MIAATKTNSTSIIIMALLYCTMIPLARGENVHGSYLRGLSDDVPYHPKDKTVYVIRHGNKKVKMETCAMLVRIEQNSLYMSSMEPNTIKIPILLPHRRHFSITNTLQEKAKTISDVTKHSILYAK